VKPAIRKPKEEEHAELKKLVSIIFPKSNVHFSKEDLVLVAVLNEEFIGFIHFTEKKNKILFNGIGIKKEFRGKGFGSQLIESAIPLLPQGIPVYLKVKASNDPAIALYVKNGFFQKKYGDVYVMVKPPQN